MRNIIILLLLVFLLAGCGISRKPAANAPTKVSPVISDTPPEETQTIEDPIYEEAQLLGTAETLEDAEALAALYGITLVDHKNGLARFHTEEDPREVIRRGRDNGWPELTLNRVSYT